jgi:DnaJ-class molecular chaperone
MDIKYTKVSGDFASECCNAPMKYVSYIVSHVFGICTKCDNPVEAKKAQCWECGDTGSIVYAGETLPEVCECQEPCEFCDGTGVYTFEHLDESKDGPCVCQAEAATERAIDRADDAHSEQGL